MFEDGPWLRSPIECGPSAGFGVYVHVPFCAHRCGYCDFATAVPDSDEQIAAYVAALRTEIRRTTPETRVSAGFVHDVGEDPAVRASYGRKARASAGFGDCAVTSVFVGGGTPTLLAAEQLAGIVGEVFAQFEVAADAEVTVECNPETASVELFEELVAAGVNRVSMGAQSFAPHVLETLERGHDADRPLEAVRQAHRAGIEQVSLDLIYGTPGETDADWEASLETVVAAGVDHVSAYALTIHDNTSFGRAVKRGEMPDVDEDVQRDRFDRARAALGAAGFEQYEISNWALGSRARSRHNLLYWRHGNYLAFGVGAHGHFDGHRWWNTRSTDRYVEAIEAGESAVSGSEQLSVAERAEERLLLGLRVREGLHPHDTPPIDPLALEDVLARDLIATACGRVQCTENGWFLLDEAVRLLT